MMEISQILSILFAIGLGMGTGSLATMVYWRLPNGEVLSGKWNQGKRAHCTSCGVKLRTRDLFPLFNWLLTFGRCLHCGAPINPIYFLIELGCTLASLTSYLLFGFGDLYIVMFGLLCSVVVLTATDFTYKTYPTAVLAAFAVCATFYRFMGGELLIDILFQFTYASFFLVMVYTTLNKYVKRGRVTPQLRYFYLVGLAALALPLWSYIYFLACAALIMAASLIISKRWTGLLLAFAFVAALLAKIIS